MGPENSQSESTQSSPNRPGMERQSDIRKETASGLKQSIVRSMMRTLMVEMMIINAMTRNKSPALRRQMLTQLEQLWGSYGQRINFMRRIGSTNAAGILPNSVVIDQVR